MMPERILMPRWTGESGTVLTGPAHRSRPILYSAHSPYSSIPISTAVPHGVIPASPLCTPTCGRSTACPVLSLDFFGERASSCDCSSMEPPAGKGELGRDASALQPPPAGKDEPGRDASALPPPPAGSAHMHAGWSSHVIPAGDAGCGSKAGGQVQRQRTCRTVHCHMPGAARAHQARSFTERHKRPGRPNTQTVVVTFTV
jgi:hypothetical protein